MQLIVKKEAMNCPRGNEMLAAAANGEVPRKLFIRKNEQNGKIRVFVEDDSDLRNVCGTVITVDGDKDLSILEQYIGKTYTLTIKGLDPASPANQMIAELSGAVIAGKGEKSQIDKEVEALIAAKVSDGTVTQEYADSVTVIFKDHGIDPFLAKRVIESWKPDGYYKREVRKPSSVYVNPDPSQKSPLYKALRLAAGRKATIYKGDKSVGKNVCGETIAYLLHMPYYLVAFNRQMMGEDLYGARTIKNDTRIEEADAQDYLHYTKRNADECLDGATRFEIARAKAAAMNVVLEKSEFVEWLEFGGYMMFNEINMAESNFLQSVANPLSDGTGFLSIPGRGRIDINPACVLAGSENEDYEGAQSQNEATISRFAGVEFPYPPSIYGQLKSVNESVNPKMLQDKEYRNCDKIYRAWREAVRKGALSNSCLNIRGFVRALDEISNAGGFETLKEQIDTQIITMCPSDERMALRSQLASVLGL